MFDQPLKTASDFSGLHAELLSRLTGDQSLKWAPESREAYPFESDWQRWLQHLFPKYLTDKATGQLAPFGKHHIDFWDWTWALQLGVAPPAMVAIWPRGGGKSTSAELAGAMVGALNKRRYVLYICETMERAEDHVSTVASMLESKAVEQYYPGVADRALSKYGHAKGWMRKRLRTASGFTVDAIGLDAAARGAKLDDVRPDFLIFDDIDGDGDSPATTLKKIKLITTKFLPAGSKDVAVAMVQNLIALDSIFSRLAGVSKEPIDMLHDRIVSGPFPAIEDLQIEKRDNRYVITGGTAIWAGMDLQTCQEMINRNGWTAFKSESQQEVGDVAGGLFDHLDFENLHLRADKVPELVRGVVAVDPAVTSTDQSDSHGIHADGIAENGLIYRIWSYEGRMTPERSLVLAINKALELRFSDVVVETDQGGDTWEFLYHELIRRLRSPEGVEIDEVIYRIREGQLAPNFNHRKGGSIGSKVHRASQMLVDYEHNRFRHVLGTHETLERALKRFPKVKPYDLVDASFWGWHFLTGGASLPFGWITNDPEFRERIDAQLAAEAAAAAATANLTEDERIALQLEAWERAQGFRA